MKTYTHEELKEILKLHKMWLLEKERGKRADLSGSDISCSNLSCSNLSGSDISCSNLSGSNLSGSELINAILTDDIKIKSKKPVKYYIGSDYYCLFVGSIIKIS